VRRSGVAGIPNLSLSLSLSLTLELLHFARSRLAYLALGRVGEY